MKASDPNREQLVKVARALGELSNEVVFVGGAIVGILVTDPAAPSVRPTKDVDVVVEVASYPEYQTKIGPALHDHGFVECTDPDAPICAWQVEGIRVDVMPTDATVLGFTNPWYQGAIATAEPYDLDGTAIRLITAPYFLATKFVAFADRGESDYYASYDLEDILAVQRQCGGCDCGPGTIASATGSAAVPTLDRVAVARRSRDPSASQLPVFNRFRAPRDPRAFRPRRIIAPRSLPVHLCIRLVTPAAIRAIMVRVLLGVSYCCDEWPSQRQLNNRTRSRSGR